jgi:hypothetical protein
MKKIAWLILAICCAAGAQTVTVQASYLYDGLNPAYGTLTLAPVTAAGQPASYHRPGGGQASITPLTVSVQNGAFTLTGVPDTALTIPANVCFQAILSTQNGSQVLGPGYSCLQPTYSNSWCTAGVCSLDNFLPSIPPLPMIAYVQSVNGCVGVCTVAGASVGDSDVTNQTASQGTVNLVGTAPATGKYRISYYANQHSVCGSGTVAVHFTFNWVDPVSARSVSSVALTIGPSQAPVTGSIQGVVPIYVLAATAVTYTSTLTGSCATGGPASYDAHIAVEEIQ